MYFPLLRRLSQYQIDSLAINLLDSWLAMQRDAVLNNLSPLRFTGQTDINHDLAIDMFLLAATPEIGVLRTKYKINCPVCDTPNGDYYSLKDIPNEQIFCKHCEHGFVPSTRLDYVDLVFERCLTPTKPLIAETVTRYHNHKGGHPGKGDSLRVTDVISGPSSARRRLLLGLDGRYEAAQ